MARAPPLRERRSDIPLLTGHFLDQARAPYKPAPALSPAPRGALVEFPWPGNIRELENAIVRALHLVDGGVIEPHHLGLPAVLPDTDSSLTWFSGERLSFKESKRRFVDAFEREYLARVIAESGGNVTKAALAARKERRELGKLLKKHGLNAKDFARVS